MVYLSYVLAGLHPFLRKYSSLKTSEIDNWPFFSLCAVFKSYFGKILLLVILNLSVIKELSNEVEQDMRNY